MMKKTMSKKKIILIILVCLIIFIIIGWWAFCVKMYNDNFNIRGESYEPIMLRVEDFDGLQCTEYSFPSSKSTASGGVSSSSKCPI